MFRLTLSALTLSLVFAGTVTAQAQDKPAKEPTQADYEKLLKEYVSNMNQVCDVLESAKDKASAEKAVLKLKALAKKSEEMQARMKKLGKPSKEIELALQKKFEPEMQKVIPRLNKEATRIGQDPELKIVIKAMGTLFGDTDKDKKPRDKPAEKDKPRDK
jgi:hypothetical protein